MPIVHHDFTGQSLYARLDDASNTALDLTEGSGLNLGRYAVADAAIASASVPAGEYNVRIFVGAAASQANTDTFVGQTPLRWSGSAEIVSASQTSLDSVAADVTAVRGDTEELQGDLADGGRLDLLVDGIKTTTDLLNPRLPGSGTIATSANVSAVEVDTQDIQSRLPAALVGGKIDAAVSDSQQFLSTTVATLASQTSFTLTAGAPDDNVYNDLAIVFTDQATPSQKSVRTVTDYVGSTRTVTIDEAPDFVIAAGDSAEVLVVPAVSLTVTGGGGPVANQPVSAEYLVTLARRNASNLVSSDIKYIQPGERAWCGVDFSNRLHSGDTVAEIVAITEKTSKTITITQGGVGGTQAKFWVEDAEDGEDYVIECRVRTVFGLVLEGDFSLSCAD